MKTIAIGDLGEFWYGDYKEPFVQLEGAVPGYPAGVIPIEPDTGKLLCAYCGKTYHHLGNHANMVHGMPAAIYKDEVGLLRKSALVSERMREGNIRDGLRRRASGMVMPRPALLGRRNTPEARRIMSEAKNKPEALNKTGRCLAQMVEVARLVAREHDGRITEPLMSKRGISVAAMRPYGGVLRIAELAGAVGLHHPRPYPEAMLLTALRDLGEELGRTPQVSDLRRYGLPSWPVYMRCFGSYREACSRAGFIPNVPLPVSDSDELAILTAYAMSGSAQKVAKRVHRGTAAVTKVLSSYGVPLFPFTPERSAERRKAREWAAEMARRISGWPDASAVA